MDATGALSRDVLFVPCQHFFFSNQSSTVSRCSKELAINYNFLEFIWSLKMCSRLRSYSYSSIDTYYMRSVRKNLTPHIGELVPGIIVWKPAKSAGTKETLPCSGRTTCMGAKAVWSESHLRGWISIVSGHLSVMSEFSYGARCSIGEWQTPALELKWSLSMKYPSWRYDPWVSDIKKNSSLIKRCLLVTYLWLLALIGYLNVSLTWNS